MKRETARQDVPRVRVRGPGARLQGRSHARAVSDRARQDSPESIVGDVRATSAPARHGDQAGAPARPAALHQGVRRLSRWRLAVGVLLFAALAPLSLVALPLAALLVAARPATRGEWLAVALAGGAGVALLTGPENGVFDALTRTWIVLVTVAFAACSRRGRSGSWSRAWSGWRWPGAVTPSSRARRSRRPVSTIERNDGPWNSSCEKTCSILAPPATWSRSRTATRATTCCRRASPTRRPTPTRRRSPTRRHASRSNARRRRAPPNTRPPASRTSTSASRSARAPGGACGGRRAGSSPTGDGRARRPQGPGPDGARSAGPDRRGRLLRHRFGHVGRPRAGHGGAPHGSAGAAWRRAASCRGAHTG